MNIIDFGRQHNNCHVMSEGFVVWKINGNDNESPVFIQREDSNIFVHILVVEGEIKAKWENRLYQLTKNNFADFMDGRLLEILDISHNTMAYVLLFTAQFMSSIMKNSTIFSPSYVLRIKIWPVSVIASKDITLIQKRLRSIEDVFKDTPHYFYTEMMNCALRMYMMDMANINIQQDNENDVHTEAGRKHILFKQFVGLLMANIHNEHSVVWYASQLYVTPQNLNRAIKSISHKTVSEHICIALIGSIIERLENTDDSVSKIAEYFNFPDIATMTKYFKRQTGKTPSEYRKMAVLL